MHFPVSLRRKAHRKNPLRVSGFFICDFFVLLLGILPSIAVQNVSPFKMYRRSKCIAVQNVSPFKMYRSSNSSANNRFLNEPEKQ
jgi:hypothetical protein